MHTQPLYRHSGARGSWLLLCGSKCVRCGMRGAGVPSRGIGGSSKSLPGCHPFTAGRSSGSPSACYNAYTDQCPRYILTLCSQVVCPHDDSAHDVCSIPLALVRAPIGTVLSLVVPKFVTGWWMHMFTLPPASLCGHAHSLLFVGFRYWNMTNLAEGQSGPPSARICSSRALCFERVECYITPPP
jgi:hypothetical protein